MSAAPLHAEAKTLHRVRRTQAERSEESRRRLLDAAFELLSERGSTLFTLAEVGERAGYSRGLPSQVFGTKAALLQQLVPHLNTVSLDIPTVDPDAVGLDAVLGLVSRILEAPPVQLKVSLGLQVLLGEAASRDSALRDSVAALTLMASRFVSGHLRKGIADGTVRRDINPRAQAMIIMAAVHGVLRQWLVMPDRAKTSELRHEMLTMLIRGVATDPAAETARWLPG
ncbi:MAG: TetR/AcrR family transcriptional regulator [Alphaproteobacteria bacterium]|nr:TetR/AcrR family transcriptional regulator [Alphaproteobacteria bacterium]